MCRALASPQMDKRDDFVKRSVAMLDKVAGRYASHAEQGMIGAAGRGGRPHLERCSASCACPSFQVIWLCSFPACLTPAQLSVIGLPIMSASGASVSPNLARAGTHAPVYCCLTNMTLWT
jgi:hypothetical protein